MSSASSINLSQYLSQKYPYPQITFHLYFIFYVERFFSLVNSWSEQKTEEPLNENENNNEAKITSQIRKESDIIPKSELDTFAKTDLGKCASLSPSMCRRKHRYLLGRRPSGTEILAVQCTEANKKKVADLEKSFETFYELLGSLPSTSYDKTPHLSSEDHSKNHHKLLSLQEIIEQRLDETLQKPTKKNIVQNKIVGHQIDSVIHVQDDNISNNVTEIKPNDQGIQN